MSVVTNDSFQSEIDELRSVLEVDPTLVIDVETNGLEPYKNNQICGIGVGQPNIHGLAQYYPFRHHQGENLSPEKLVQLIELLNSKVESYIGYNIKFRFTFFSREKA